MAFSVSRSVPPTRARRPRKDEPEENGIAAIHSRDAVTEDTHRNFPRCWIPCKGALRSEALLPPASDAAVGSLGWAYVTDVVILAAHPRVPLRAGGCAVTLQPAAQPDIVRRVYPKVSCQVGLTAFAVPARCFVTRQEPSAHASGGTSARAPHLRGSGRSCAVAGNFPVRRGGRDGASMARHRPARDAAA